MCLLDTFERVTARSDKLAAAAAAAGGPGGSPRARSGSFSREQQSPRGQPASALGLGALTLDSEVFADSSAIAVGDGYHHTAGLYTRRQSNVGSSSPLVPPSNLASPNSDTRPDLNASPQNRSEKTGWLKGDLNAAKGLIVHANPSRTGGVYQLDLRKEGFVDGLGSWRFTAQADVVSTSSLGLFRCF